MTTLETVNAHDRIVWRVGFLPRPWAWSGWEWAGPNGRFNGRWDDCQGNFRTVYAGDSLMACFLEVLACFRPDPELAAELAQIRVDDGDEAEAPAGGVPVSWIEPRCIGRARLRGDYVNITSMRTIAALHPTFAAAARASGCADFDAAALKDSKDRSLTQAVATYVYERTDCAGLHFSSRHGDNQPLWAIFERPGDPSVSPRLRHCSTRTLSTHHPALREAMTLLNLTWFDDRPPSGPRTHG